MLRRAPLLALVVLLLAPAGARAGKVTIGSDLVAPATITESHPRDWAAWPTDLASGAATRAEVQGEVTLAQLKGTIVKPGGASRPDVVARVIVLRPRADGTKELIVTSDPLPVPFGGDPQQVSTFDLQAQPPRVCVEKGDMVALATSGGFGPADYPDGAEFQTFGRVPGSSIAKFSETPNGSFQTGSRVRADTKGGEELLMRVTIGTGADARYTCRTTAQQNQNLDAPQPRSSLATVAPRKRAARVRDGKLKVKLSCDGPKRCSGSLTVTKKSGKVLGRSSFDLQAGESARLRVGLSRQGKRLLRRKRGGKLPVTAVAETDAGKTRASLVLKRRR